MDIALGHDAGERRGDPQIPFHVADGFERLPRGFDVLLRRRDLSLVGFHGLLREHDIVAGDDAWRRRRGLEPLVRARVGVGLRPHRAELRLARLQLRLRFGPLRDQLGRVEHGDQLARADPRAAVDANGLHESGDPRKHRDRLIRRFSSPGIDNVTSSGCSTTRTTSIVGRRRPARPSRVV